MLTFIFLTLCFSIATKKILSDMLNLSFKLGILQGKAIKLVTV
jgi:hypothetical protein